MAVSFNFISTLGSGPYPMLQVNAQTNPGLTDAENWVLTYSKDPITNITTLFAYGSPAFLGYISGLIPNLTNTDFSSLTNILATGS